MKKRDVIIITICVATAIVCMCLTFWGNLKNNGVLTIDAFMGVIATLIGVCATIIVGFQIASYLELRETKIQVEKLQKERERLETISDEINDVRSDLANAFVAISADTSNDFLRIVSLISTITVDDMATGKSKTLLNRYKKLYGTLKDDKSHQCLELSSIQGLTERLRAVSIPKEFEHYDEIMQLHYEIINILNKSKVKKGK